MKFKNTSKFDSKLLREIINFVKPSGVSNFDIWVKNNTYGGYAGRCYYNGCSFSGRFNPYVVIRMSCNCMPYPYTTTKRQGKGYIGGIKLYNDVESLVYLIAHELRHLWQSQHKKGYRYYKSKGQFSERDASCYGLHKVREWRRT